MKPAAIVVLAGCQPSVVIDLAVFSRYRDLTAVRESLGGTSRPGPGRSFGILRSRRFPLHLRMRVHRPSGLLRYRRCTAIHPSVTCRSCVFSASRASSVELIVMVLHRGTPPAASRYPTHARSRNDRSKLRSLSMHLGRPRPARSPQGAVELMSSLTAQPPMLSSAQRAECFAGHAV
jgi:hypothetical protein